MTEPSRQELRRDTAAALGARRDLGPDYEDDIAANLADRVEALVDQRVAQRSGQVGPTEEDRKHARDEEKANGDGRFVIALASLGAGIPITAIASDSTVTTIVAWAGIVGVNVAAALSARRRR